MIVSRALNRTGGRCRIQHVLPTAAPLEPLELAFGPGCLHFFDREMERSHTPSLERESAG
jgi:hypothetical protein